MMIGTGKINCIKKDKTDHRVIHYKIRRGESGVALIMVLWIMAMLIVISFSFSVMARTEIFSTMTFKEQMINKYLAEAGFQRAIMEILYRNLNKNKQVTLLEEEVCRADGTFYQAEMGNGYYKFNFMDESGKININTMTDATGIILNNLLVNSGVEKETADTIVD